MKVLIVGSGGREHALAWHISNSPRVEEVICCPGNGGTASFTTTWADSDLSADTETFTKRVGAEGIGRVVIGPEAPLVEGLADQLRSAGIPVFGCDKAGARLEGSKAYSKEFMARHRIPAARSITIDNLDQIDEALEHFPKGVVVKASGLAAGKGVTVTRDLEEAKAIATGMLSGDSFGISGETVVLEEILEGPELSILAFVSGRNYQLLEGAQDHKPLLDGNRGPNTGGMGAFSPTDTLDEVMRSEVIEKIVEPTLAGLERDGIDYRGLLYFGLMLTNDGPRVLEYNCRFGDPETQPVLMRLETDLLDVFDAIDDGTIGELELKWNPMSALCLVLAARGYPQAPTTGEVVSGDLKSSSRDPVQVFHAGTRLEGGELVTSGGRVFGITALGENLEEARERAYRRAQSIDFPSRVYREDIGTLHVEA